MQKALFIRAEWDDEASVWVATSDDVPGLATEADTLEALSAKLESLVPELLEANGCPNVGDVPFELLARKYAIAHGIGFSPITGVRFPVDQKIKSRHTANAVLRQAGLPKGF